MMQAKATYLVKEWAREASKGESAHESTGAQFIRVGMTHLYQGDIEGEATSTPGRERIGY